SKNNQLDEYCVNTVATLLEPLDPLSIPHPVLVTESGRATVAYSSMLLFNILDVRTHTPKALPATLDDSHHDMIHNLMAVLNDINERNVQECYNNALYYRDEVRGLFNRGQVYNRVRALTENIIFVVNSSI